MISSKFLSKCLPILAQPQAADKSQDGKASASRPANERTPAVQTAGHSRKGSFHFLRMNRLKSLWNTKRPGGKVQATANTASQQQPRLTMAQFNERKQPILAKINGIQKGFLKRKAEREAKLAELQHARKRKGRHAASGNGPKPAMASKPGSIERRERVIPDIRQDPNHGSDTDTEVEEQLVRRRRTGGSQPQATPNAERVNTDRPDAVDNESQYLELLLHASDELALQPDEIVRIGELLQQSPRDAEWNARREKFQSDLERRLFADPGTPELMRIAEFSEQMHVGRGGAAYDQMIQWLDQARTLPLTPTLLAQLERKTDEVHAAKERAGDPATEANWADFRQWLLNEAASASLDDPGLEKFIAAHNSASRIDQELHAEGGSNADLKTVEEWLFVSLDWPLSPEQKQHVELMLQRIEDAKVSGTSAGASAAIRSDAWELTRQLVGRTFDVCKEQIQQAQVREQAYENARKQRTAYSQVVSFAAASGGTIRTDAWVPVSDDAANMSEDDLLAHGELIDLIEETLVNAPLLKLSDEQKLNLEAMKRRLEQDFDSPDLTQRALGALRDFQKTLHDSYIEDKPLIDLGFGDIDGNAEEPAMVDGEPPSLSREAALQDMENALRRIEKTPSGDAAMDELHGLHELLDSPELRGEKDTSDYGDADASWSLEGTGLENEADDLRFLEESLRELDETAGTVERSTYELFEMNPKTNPFADAASGYMDFADESENDALTFKPSYDPQGMTVQELRILQNQAAK